MLEGQVTAQQGHRQGGTTNDRAGVLIHAGRVVARQRHTDSGRNRAVNTGKTAISKHACGCGLAQGGGGYIQVTHQVRRTQHEQAALSHRILPDAAGVGAAGGAVAVIGVVNRALSTGVFVGGNGAQALIL